MKSRFHASLLVAAGLALLASVARAADDNTTSVKFSDPSKPGTLKVNVGRGEIQIAGTDTNEVSVRSDSKPITGKPRKDGLRVISSSAAGFSLTEKDNVVTIDSAAHDWGRGNADFKVTVPRNTSVIVQNAWGGDFKCTGINGDLEISSMHGEIRLEDMGGGVVVSTMNGEIRASMRQLQEGKPLSFTSMNGEIVVRVPESAKANVRLRTQNGSVLTDFDDSALVTKAENTPGGPRGRTINLKTPNSKVIAIEVEEAIREATRISATAVRESLEAVKQGLEASRVDFEDARRQVEEARSQMERARRDAERERDRERRTTRAEATARAEAAATASPVLAPTPPKPPAIAKVPTISGGKLVTGTLNGGGPEISIATMNGDVTLRKLDKK